MANQSWYPQINFPNSQMRNVSYGMNTPEAIFIDQQRKNQQKQQQQQEMLKSILTLASLFGGMGETPQSGLKTSYDDLLNKNVYGWDAGGGTGLQNAFNTGLNQNFSLGNNAYYPQGFSGFNWGGR